VLTGGEPMVAKGIRELASALRAAGKHITIETAATIPPDGIACNLASLSPKPESNTAELPDDAAVWGVQRNSELTTLDTAERAWISVALLLLDVVTETL
jgi:7-carboxy-7-deazaguanine synthase